VISVYLVRDCVVACAKVYFDRSRETFNTCELLEALDISFENAFVEGKLVYNWLLDNLARVRRYEE